MVGLPIDTHHPPPSEVEGSGITLVNWTGLECTEFNWNIWKGIIMVSSSSYSCIRVYVCVCVCTCTTTKSRNEKVTNMTWQQLQSNQFHQFHGSNTVRRLYWKVASAPALAPLLEPRQGKVVWVVLHLLLQFTITSRFSEGMDAESHGCSDPLCPSYL